MTINFFLVLMYVYAVNSVADKQV